MFDKLFRRQIGERSGRSEQEKALSSSRKRSYATGIALVMCLALGWTLCGCNERQNYVKPEVEQKQTGKVTLPMGGVDTVLELAETDQKRSLGLMRRKTLSENHGMLFIYPEAKILRFYMRDTWIPLSIAFIKENGTIINIEEMRPNTETPSHIAKGFCRYAIEMNKGWFDRHNLKPGDKITWTPEILAIEAR